MVFDLKLKPKMQYEDVEVFSKIKPVIITSSQPGYQMHQNGTNVVGRLILLSPCKT